MKKNQTRLEQLKGQNPFSVPEGYMEGLADNIINQLPEKPRVEAQKISMMDRVRPWLYMAAVFAGLGLFFKAIVGITDSNETGKNPDSLLVRTEVRAGIFASQSEDDYYDEDTEYLEYIEAKYANYILAEEMGYSE